MAHATPYSLFKAAMVGQLRARPGLAGVEVSYDAPNEVPDVRAKGSWESIHFDTETGTSDNVIMCAGNLRFDYDYLQTAVVQVLRPMKLGTQQRADERVEELLYEVCAELASQKDWDMDALGLDDFDYFQATPSTIDHTTGKLASPGHGAGCELSIRVQARRSFT